MRDDIPVFHDAFRPRGLDSAGWLLLRRLHFDAPTTVAELGAQIGLSPDRARKTIAACERVGLAQERREGWVGVAPPADVALEDAAAILGTSGALERDRSQYAIDREEDERRVTARKPPLTGMERDGPDVAALERKLVDLVVREGDSSRVES